MDGGAPRPAGRGQPKREELKRRLFQKCDKDGDGVLTKGEMRELAEKVGFEGSEEDWTEEYELLCAEHQLEADQGIPASIIMTLLEDKSELGLYCTNQEICQLLGIEHTKAEGGDGDEGNDTEFTRVFFAGANFGTAEAILKSVFEEAGKIEEFSLFRLQDGRSMGMGRIKYASHGEAKNALDTLHKREIDGREVMLQVDQRGEDNGEGGGKRKGKGKGKDGGDKGKGKHKDGAAGGGHEQGGWHDDGWSRGRYGKGGGETGGGHSDNRTVFFAGASFSSSANFLRRQFQECGRITQFWLFQERNGNSRGMGVVQYQTPREANKAVEVLAGKEVNGRNLYVRIDDKGLLYKYQANQDGGAFEESWDASGGGWGGKGAHGGKGKGAIGPVGGGWGGGGETAWGKGQQGYGQQAWDKGGGGKGSYDHGGGKKGGFVDNQSNRVFFSGVPFKAPVSAVQEYFAVFGDIRSFTVFKRADGASRGMGVCVFQYSSSAAAAIQDGIIIDGRPLFMQEDTSKSGEEPGSWHEAPPKGYGKGGRNQDYEEPPHVDPNKSVLFRNVPFETTEKFLKDKFESVGTVKTFALFTKSDGRSRGAGVVEYFTTTAAERAYNELHDNMVSGRPINVDYYTHQ